MIVRNQHFRFFSNQLLVVLCKSNQVLILAAQNHRLPSLLSFPSILPGAEVNHQAKLFQQWSSDENWTSTSNCVASWRCQSLPGVLKIHLRCLNACQGLFPGPRCIIVKGGFVRVYSSHIANYPGGSWPLDKSYSLRVNEGGGAHILYLQQKDLLASANFPLGFAPENGPHQVSNFLPKTQEKAIFRATWWGPFYTL